tara:strand:+ start:1002 stop:1283 length:282 start_codon:yes stop_codon:yes gene_type:complete
MRTHSPPIDLVSLKVNEHAHNEMDPRTYVVFSRVFKPGAKRTFVDLAEGIGTARRKAAEWTIAHGDGLVCGLAAEFTRVEHWEGKIPAKGAGR